ncbi:hypothetical protein OROMI_009342 [Orobanche minor]
MNPLDDKGCIYGLGSLGVALSAPATSSSQSGKTLLLHLSCFYRFVSCLQLLDMLTWGNDGRDWGHHDNIWGNLWLSSMNPPDDKGCIYGLGSLGVALSTPATSSSQVSRTQPPPS